MSSLPLHLPVEAENHGSFLVHGDVHVFIHHVFNVLKYHSIMFLFFSCTFNIKVPGTNTSGVNLLGSANISQGNCSVSRWMDLAHARNIDLFLRSIEGWCQAGTAHHQTIPCFFVRLFLLQGVPHPHYRKGTEAPRGSGISPRLCTMRCLSPDSPSVFLPLRRRLSECEVLFYSFCDTEI